MIFNFLDNFFGMIIKHFKTFSFTLVVIITFNFFYASFAQTNQFCFNIFLVLFIVFAVWN